MFKDESEEFGARLHDWLQTQQAISHLFSEGQNDPLFAWMFSTDSGNEFWEKNKTIYSTTFVSRVEKIKALIRN